MSRTRGVAAFALVAVLAVPVVVRAAPPAPASAAASQQARRAPPPGVPSPQPLAVDPREAVAFVAAVVCGLLLLQYAHRRTPFILLWAAGWLLIAPSMLLVSRDYASPLAGRAAAGLSQWLGICTAALFLWSGDIYRQTGYLNPKRLRAVAWLAVWFVGAPLLFGTGTVMMPGYVIQAALLVVAGSMYTAVLLERRMIGAGLVAFVLFGLAVSSITTAFALPQIALVNSFAVLLGLNGILYACGAVGIHLLIFEDMTYELRVTNRRLEAAREELLQAAITDPLTGCHNRRFLDEVVTRELQRHERFDLPLSLLFIDVNRFKQINDRLGHDAGDRVLQYVARFLKSRIREADYVFRWGGDEFLALITCTGDEARRKAGALKAAFEAAPETKDLPPGIGLSVGWAEVPGGTTDLMPLVNDADQRMYRDKRPPARRRSAKARSAATDADR
ncbi:MAG: diguanylate cyclase [Betaproteobacteria bacterium]